jgi:hypothetical protein
MEIDPMMRVFDRRPLKSSPILVKDKKGILRLTGSTPTEGATSTGKSRRFEALAKPAALAPHAHPLPPKDPDAVAGNQPITNVITADTDYTMGQNDFAVIAQGPLTVTLTDFPLTATPVLIISDTGANTVNGGTNPIQGGPITLDPGTMTFFSFSPLSGEWSVLAAVSSGNSLNTIFVDTGTTDALPGQTLACETSTGPISIVMPLMGLNKTVEIVDYDSDASVNSITVSPPLGWSLMDPNTLAYAAPGASIVMNVNGASVTWESDGGRHNRLFII